MSQSELATDPGNAVDQETDLLAVVQVFCQPVFNDRGEDATVPHRRLFKQQVQQIMEHALEEVHKETMSLKEAESFFVLLQEIDRRIMNCPAIAANNYLCRFSRGVNFSQARHELQQFSVFAIHFDIAQAKLVANAPTREIYTKRLQVLLNEKGIPYKNGFEGELTGLWDEHNIHFTWLEQMADGLELSFEDIGKIWIANEGTKAFVYTVFTHYASTNSNIATGAAFGIETWAANALWKQWIDGMEKLNISLENPVPLGYLTHHDTEERHHSQATLFELFAQFRGVSFDKELFFRGASNVLTKGIQVYYESQLETMPHRDATWPMIACG